MPDPTKHILLMDGPDSKGLIYHVTGVLYRHSLNIIHNDEYVSPAGWFFMRTEFEGTLDKETLLAELNTTLPRAEHSDGRAVRARVESTAKNGDEVTSNKFQDLSYVLDKQIWQFRVHMQ